MFFSVAECLQNKRQKINDMKLPVSKSVISRKSSVSMAASFLIFAGLAPLAAGQAPRRQLMDGMTSGMGKMMHQKQAAVEAALAADYEAGLEALSNLPCVEGMAGEYPCKDVDLLSFTPRRELYG
jgi:hypothetical protein